MNTTNARTVDLKVMDLLALVLSEAYMDIREPKTNKKRTEVVRANITSPLARRAYSAYVQLAEEQNRLAIEHMSLHDGSSTGHDCAVFQRAYLGLKLRAEFMFALFTAAVRQEHPITLGEEDVGFCAGWTLVTDEGTEWDVLYADTKLCEFLVPLTEIVDGKPFTFPDVQLTDGIPPGASLVAVLEDPRIRSLVALLSHVQVESNKGVPGTDVTDDPVRRREWMNSQTLGSMKRMNAQVDWGNCVSGALSKLVSAAIWDLYPEIKLRSFGLFEGWKVMSFPTPVIKHFMMNGVMLDPNSSLAKTLESLAGTLESVSRRDRTQASST